MEIDFFYDTFHDERKSYNSVNSDNSYDRINKKSDTVKNNELKKKELLKKINKLKK